MKAHVTYLGEESMGPDGRAIPGPSFTELLDTRFDVGKPVLLDSENGSFNKIGSALVEQMIGKLRRNQYFKVEDCDDPEDAAFAHDGAEPAAPPAHKPIRKKK